MSSSSCSGAIAPASTRSEIAEGLEIVEKQLKDRTVRTGEEELFKARAKETGSVKIIDILRARLDAKNDCYVAELPSLNLRDVRIDDQLVRDNERMLTDGFYAEVTLALRRDHRSGKRRAPVRSVGSSPDPNVEVRRARHLCQGPPQLQHD